MRAFIIFVLSLFFVTISVSPVEASLVTISSSGGISINVLGEHVDKEVNVSKIAIADNSEKDKVFFSREDNSVKLSVVTENGEETLEVTDFGDDLVEIESRPDTERVVIGIDGNNYTLTQGNLKTSTDFDISIDPENARLSLATPQGIRFVSVFPKDATDLLLKSKTFSNLSEDNPIRIVENEDGFLTYEVVGIKNINVLNLIDLPIEITGYVSTSTGEIVSVDQPVWLPIAEYLFS
ncbi:hypothetical protein ACFL2C_02980 [Patescibacteria group bacterium]